MSLVDENGAATGASAIWSSDGTWALPIPDVPGDNRMMRGYLDTPNGNPSSVNVSGLAAGTYDIYVYTDGDNAGFSRTALYQCGAVTPPATDPANTNFSGTFIQAAN